MRELGIFIAIWCSIISWNTYAESEIIIYGTNNKPPKIYLEEGNPKGILVDILTYIDNRMSDYRFTIELYPFPRAYQYALSGKGAIIGLSKNAEREKLFSYSDTVYLDEIVVVTKAGKEFDFNSFNDLRGKHVSTGLGASYGQAFEEAKHSGLVHFVEDKRPQFGLHKLLSERVDCVLINPGVEGLDYLLASDSRLEEHRSDFTVLQPPLAVDPNFLGMSILEDSHTFLNEFNKVLEQGFVSGDIPKIIRNYTRLSKR